MIAAVSRLLPDPARITPAHSSASDPASGYLFRDRLLAPGDTLPLKKGSLFDVGGEDGAPIQFCCDR